MEKKEVIADRISPKNVEKTAHPTDRSMSPVFSVPATSTTISQQAESKPGSIEVVETVEEMGSGSFSDNIRDEQLDTIVVESIEELTSTSQ